jgi:signal transduction histidine kinase
MLKAMNARWDLMGLVAGAGVGGFDVGLFAAFGARMEMGGTDVAALVLAIFVISYAALGFFCGRLFMARTRARANADTIARQLQDLEKAQRALFEHEKLAAIGRLAAGIAHEVRNPLGVIRASASLIQEDFAAADDSYRACQFICDETDRLDGLIASLLAFARPTTPEVRAVALADVLAHALRLASEELDRREILVECEATAALPVIQGDANLLSQAVLDLTLNAAQALEREGRIVVRASAEAERVRVDVCDDGPGVPADVAGQIFEPFFTTKATGTGLGLPMAARIVEAHGGCLELVPGAGAGGNGRGACFRISLPVQAQPRMPGVPGVQGGRGAGAARGPAT